MCKRPFLKKKNIINKKHCPLNSACLQKYTSGYSSLKRLNLEITDSNCVIEKAKPLQKRQWEIKSPQGPTQVMTLGIHSKIINKCPFYA